MNKIYKKISAGCRISLAFLLLLPVGLLFLLISFLEPAVDKLLRRYGKKAGK